MPTKPIGLLGFCLLHADLDTLAYDELPYWWLVNGGFAPVPKPFPLLLPNRKTALDFIRKLQARLPLSAYPSRLALANTR